MDMALSSNRKGVELARRSFINMVEADLRSCINQLRELALDSNVEPEDEKTYKSAVKAINLQALELIELQSGVANRSVEDFAENYGYLWWVYGDISY